MGAIESVLTGLNAVTTAIGAVNNAVGALQGIGHDPEKERRKALRAQQDLMLRQLQQQQQIGTANAREQAALERERIAAEATAAEEQRRAALRRAVARQRAAFGAQGTGSGEGSAQAVLLGLFAETDEDRARRERMDDIRNRFISQDLGARERINILQRAQLAERQRLERIAGRW